MTASSLNEKYTVSGHSSSDIQIHIIIQTWLITVKSDKIISELEGILEVQMYYFVFRSVTLTYYSLTYFFQAMVLK